MPSLTPVVRRNPPACRLLMNSDLFPNQARQNSATANAATEDDETMSAAMLTPTLGSSPLAAGSAPPTALAAQSIDGNSVTSFGSTTGGVTTVTTAMGVPAVKTEGDSSAATKGESMSDKRRRRLEKNRVIARNCRKRKRERMQELEEQVKQLSSANQQLRLRLKRGNDLRRKEDKRVQELARIQEMTRTGASETEVAKAIIAYKDLVRCPQSRPAVVVRVPHCACRGHVCDSLRIMAKIAKQQ